MPTTATAEALAPGQKRTPSESVAYGRMQWTRKWKVFASQWSQPQLMKLAEAVLGEKALHSSQIHGFTTGKLRDPAPKVVMAVGKLNKAIAFANGADVLMDEFDGRCPESMPDLWRGKSWMVAPNGRVLGELECFAAITGMLDLATEGAHLDLHKGNMPAVSKSLGRYLRKRFMDRGIDFMDPDEAYFMSSPAAHLVQDLVYGKEITGAAFDEHKAEIADVAGVEVDQLVDEAVLPVVLASEDPVDVHTQYMPEEMMVSAAQKVRKAAAKANFMKREIDKMQAMKDEEARKQEFDAQLKWMEYDEKRKRRSRARSAVSESMDYQDRYLRPDAKKEQLS